MGVIKEGGKRGVEIEGAADMGGLQFFSTAVEEPDGDVELLLKSMEAMNQKCDPTEEERKGGSGHVGKMIFSAGTTQLAIVAYVPEEKQAELSCEEWINKVLSTFPGGKLLKSDKSICSGIIPADGDKGIFPLKIREGLIMEANNFLRGKGLFPDNDSDDDEMVFGDDDFPSASDEVGKVENAEEEPIDVDDPLAMLGGMGEETFGDVTLTLIQESSAMVEDAENESEVLVAPPVAAAAPPAPAPPKRE